MHITVVVDLAPDDSARNPKGVGNKILAALAADPGKDSISVSINATVAPPSPTIPTPPISTLPVEEGDEV